MGRLAGTRVMTFYDYDMHVNRDGRATYHLRAGMKPLRPYGAYCTVRPYGDDRWERVTRWHSRHGTRYFVFPTLDEALTAGVNWARRREAEDARKAKR